MVLASHQPDGQLSASMARLVPQCTETGAELIVARGTHVPPAIERDATQIVRCPGNASMPQVRGAGLAVATGDLVLLTEDNCVVAGDWIGRIAAGIAPDADVAGGVVGNARLASAIDAAAGFAEYGFYGPFQPDAAVPALASANVAYRRRVVDSVAEWSLAGTWESWIHERLAQGGARFTLIRDAIVEQNNKHRAGRFCRNRYEHGREYAVHRGAARSRRTRFLLTAGTLLLPPVLTWRVWRRAGRAAPGAFLRALPCTLLFFGAWSAGEASGYLSGGEA